MNESSVPLMLIIFGVMFLLPLVLAIIGIVFLYWSSRKMRGVVSDSMLVTLHILRAISIAAVSVTAALVTSMVVLSVIGSIQGYGSGLGVLVLGPIFFVLYGSLFSKLASRHARNNQIVLPSSSN